MSPFELRQEIIEPTLRGLNLYSQSASDLLLGTCGIESNFGQYVRQINGPALGIFQCEPATHKDIWENYLKYRLDLRERVCAMFHLGEMPPDDLLVTNPKYATAICRIHYLRVADAMPQPGNPDYPERLADYYKEHYNTSLGACTLEKACSVFKSIATEPSGEL